MDPRWIPVPLALALLLAGTPSVAATDVARHTVLTAGKPSGEQQVERLGDEMRVRYHFDDRGRGPEQSSSWRVDARGIPVELRVDGVGYRKNPVEERFSRDASGLATWSGTGDAGEAQAPDALYVPENAPPAFTATLVAALREAPDQSLALLPAGQARLVGIGMQALDDFGDVHGYEIHGLGYLPATVWLDRDDRFFASLGGWLDIVLQGYEDSLAPLRAAQEQRQQQRAVQWARELARRPEEPVLIHNARVFDPRDGRVDEAHSVLLVGERIVAVGADGSLPLPDHYEAFDAGGRFLMPGLWDNHVHLGAADGLLHLAAGVTTVRDLGNDERTLPARVARFDTGEEIGPRVLMGGFLDGPGEFAGPSRALVDDAAAAERWIDGYAEQGYVQVKLYSSLDPSLVPAIARAAHARGMRLSGHVPAYMSAESFVLAGADELQHINFVLLNFLTAEAADTRDMTRFTAVGEHAWRLRPDGEAERAFIELLRRRDVSVDVTVNIFERMFEARDAQVQPGYGAVVGRLPPQVARGLRGGGLIVPDGLEDAYARAFPTMLAFVRALHEAGVALVPGTDSPAGFGMHRELELWVRAGIPEADVLRAATLGSARVNRRDAELGRIAPGQKADLILVDGDPLRDISELRRVRTTIRGGVFHDADALYGALGVAPVP